MDGTVWQFALSLLAQLDLVGLGSSSTCILNGLASAQLNQVMSYARAGLIQGLSSQIWLLLSSCLTQLRLGHELELHSIALALFTRLGPISSSSWLVLKHEYYLGIQAHQKPRPEQLKIDQVINRPTSEAWFNFASLPVALKNKAKRVAGANTLMVAW